MVTVVVVKEGAKEKYKIGDSKSGVGSWNADLHMTFQPKQFLLKMF